jgi:hypothetical protein
MLQDQMKSFLALFDSEEPVVEPTKQHLNEGLKPRPDWYDEIRASAKQLKFPYGEAVMMAANHQPPPTEPGIRNILDQMTYASRGERFPDEKLRHVSPRKPGFSEDLEDAGVKYGVFRKGGSIGGDNSKPVKTFDSKEEAKAYAQDRRKGLSQGERGYYRMSYVVKPIKNISEDFDSDVQVEDDDMAKNQIHTIRRAAAALEHIIDNDRELPQWIHSKITIAKDYLDTVHEYLASAEERDVERVTGEEGVEIAQENTGGMRDRPGSDDKSFDLAECRKFLNKRIITG